MKLVSDQNHVNTPRPVSAHGGFTGDAILRVVLVTIFAMGCMIALVIAMVIIQGSALAFRDIPLLRFISDTDWHPTIGMYDLKPMLVGSLLTALGAVFVATPISLAIAATLNYYLSGPAASFFRRGLFVMAAMPTVVFGFWGLTQIVPLVGMLKPPGVSLISGILILSLMIIPTTSLLIDVAFSKVPQQLVHGAYALGASSNLTCFGMALRVIKRAVLSATLLGLGRALGETIVVIMVTGNKAELPQGVFDPIRTLTANVALEIGYADPLHSATLFLSILILFLVATGLAIVTVALENATVTSVDV